MKRMFVLILLVTLFVFAAQAQRRTGNTRDPDTGNSGSNEKPSRSSKGHADEETPVRPYPVFIDFCPSVPTVIIVEQPVYVLEDEKAEVREAILHDCNSKPGSSGFDFSSEDVLSCHNTAVDIYFSIGKNGPEFIVAPDADIQNCGPLPFSNSMPSTDWMPSHRVNAEPENVYVLWTWDNQYYAFRVNALTDSRVYIEWNKLDGGARIASNEDYRNGKHHRDASIKFDR